MQDKNFENYSGYYSPNTNGNQFFFNPNVQSPNMAPGNNLNNNLRNFTFPLFSSLSSVGINGLNCFLVNQTPIQINPYVPSPGDYHPIPNFSNQLKNLSHLDRPHDISSSYNPFISIQASPMEFNFSQNFDFSIQPSPIENLSLNDNFKSPIPENRLNVSLAEGNLLETNDKNNLFKKPKKKRQNNLVNQPNFEAILNITDEKERIELSLSHYEEFLLRTYKNLDEIIKILRTTTESFREIYADFLREKVKEAPSIPTFYFNRYPLLLELYGETEKIITAFKISKPSFIKKLNENSKQKDWITDLIFIEKLKFKMENLKKNRGLTPSRLFESKHLDNPFCFVVLHNEDREVRDRIGEIYNQLSATQFLNCSRQTIRSRTDLYNAILLYEDPEEFTLINETKQYLSNIKDKYSQMAYVYKIYNEKNLKRTKEYFLNYYNFDKKYIANSYIKNNVNFKEIVSNSRSENNFASSNSNEKYRFFNSSNSPTQEDENSKYKKIKPSIS